MWGVTLEQLGCCLSRAVMVFTKSVLVPCPCVGAKVKGSMVLVSHFGWGIKAHRFGQ